MIIAFIQQIVVLYLFKNIIFVTNCIDKVSSNRKKQQKIKRRENEKNCTIITYNGSFRKLNECTEPLQNSI